MSSHYPVLVPWRDATRRPFAPPRSCPRNSAAVAADQKRMELADEWPVQRQQQPLPLAPVDPLPWAVGRRLLAHPRLAVVADDCAALPMKCEEPKSAYK